MRMMIWQGLVCLIVIALNQHLCRGTATKKETFTCAKDDITKKQLDRCWTHTTTNHVTNTKSESITCCPTGYFCCEGSPNTNSGKPPCCPLGSACKTDGTCEIPKKIAECYTNGDPHYMSFDRQKMTYQGVCRMSLVKSHIRTSNTEKFEIFSRNYYRTGSTSVAYPEYLELYILNDVYRIQRNPAKTPPTEVYLANGPAPVNMKAKGKLINLSKTYVGKNVTIKMLTSPANTVYLSTDYGVEITYDGKWIGKIFLDERYKNHVTGLCGNYDGSKANDLEVAPAKHKGANVGKRASVVSVANSYIVHDVEPHEKTCVHKVQKVKNPAHDLIIKGACHVIYDKKGPFAECAAKLGADRIKYMFDSCVYDGSQMGYPTVCENLKALKDECTEHQITINADYEPKCDEDVNKCF